MDRKRSFFTFRKRSFLNPASTGYTSYILAEVESSQDGAYKLLIQDRVNETSEQF